MIPDFLMLGWGCCWFLAIKQTCVTDLEKEKNARLNKLFDFLKGKV